MGLNQMFLNDIILFWAFRLLNTIILCLSNNPLNDYIKEILKKMSTNHKPSRCMWHRRVNPIYNN